MFNILAFYLLLLASTALKSKRTWCWNLFFSRLLSHLPWQRRMQPSDAREICLRLAQSDWVYEEKCCEMICATWPPLDFLSDFNHTQDRWPIRGVCQLGSYFASVWKWLNLDHHTLSRLVLLHFIKEIKRTVYHIIALCFLRERWLAHMLVWFLFSLFVRLQVCMLPKCYNSSTDFRTVFVFALSFLWCIKSVAT